MFSYKKFAGLLSRLNTTAHKVAKDTGITRSTFSDWKSGRSCPKVGKVKILADYFEVSLEYFLE